MFPSFDLSSARKQAEGSIIAMIPCQTILYKALSKDTDSFLIVCVLVCVRGGCGGVSSLHLRSVLN